jgi:hypothetical protein
MKWLLPYLLLLTMGCVATCANAQTGMRVFNDSIVHRIDVTITLPDWLAVLDEDYALNAAYPDSFPEIYRPCLVLFDGDLIAPAGIREKGNSSNIFNEGRKKKPFKIAFDAFVEQKFDGLKKINLNNCTNDPSLMREALVYRLFRKNGLVAPRTSFAKVYFNGEYWGLYLLVENVDKTFLRDRYGNGNEDGNLYKTTRAAGATLEWFGDSASDYDSHLKLTTNEALNDWRGFIHFVDVLNHTSDDSIPTELPKVFDVAHYLTVLALEKLVRSWDNYASGGNNYCLYEHPDGVMRWIPWDVNETFQDIKVLSPTPLLDGNLIPTRAFEARPLIRRIFEVPAWKAAYLDGVCTLLKHSFVVDSLAENAVRLHDLIDEAYREDPNKLNSYDAFVHALNSENLEVVPLLNTGYALRLYYPGIFPFVQSQRKWAFDQLNEWDVDCEQPKAQKRQLQIFPNPTNAAIHLQQGSDAFDYAEISIYDSQGKRHAQFPWQGWIGSVITLDVAALTPGMYFVVQHSANGNVGTGKFVKL